MDFSLGEAESELAALTRTILAREVTEDSFREATGFDPSLWAWLSSAGILSAGLPEPAGGSDLGLPAHCAVLTEIGRAMAPAPYLPSIMLGASTIARFGTPAQIRLWGAPAGRGQMVLTAALCEEDGDDPLTPSATASYAGGHWVLSGTKTTVDAGARADLMLVPASTPQGVTVFLVDPGDQGVFLAPQRLVDASGAAQVTFGGARVPEARVLGAPGDGAAIVQWLVSRAMTGLCALQLGVLERALEMTASYVRSREVFGRPVGSFQAVSQRLADAYIDVEAVRLSMWQAAYLLSESSPEAGQAIATAKFWAAEAGHRVAHTAVHLHGGVGIDESYPLHRYFTAAKRCEFVLGGATAQLRRIGAALASA
jgi:3-oxocholest-4-en-26-oyl-CoA dehydrogenase beta subunit